MKLFLVSRLGALDRGPRSGLTSAGGSWLFGVPSELLGGVAKGDVGKNDFTSEEG